MLTELCILNPFRVVETDDKKKKPDEDEIEDIDDEEAKKNKQYEFLNLSELT